MRRYIEYLLQNGYLVVCGFFITSPLLIAGYLTMGLSFFVWFVVVWVAILIASGLVNPDWLFSGQDDDYYQEIR